MSPESPDEQREPVRQAQGLPARAADEQRDVAGPLADAYARFFERFDEARLAVEAKRVAGELAERGVDFRAGGTERRPFLVDVVPRLIAADEWSLVEKGVAQRVRALNAFLADVYGGMRIVEAGVMPERLVTGAEWFEAGLAEQLYRDSGGRGAVIRAHAIGPDLVRDEDGLLRVLEDNTRAPSGMAYLLAARQALAPMAEAAGLEPRSLDAVPEMLHTTIRDAVPPRCIAEDPVVVLLNDGPDAPALYEHEALARELGMRVTSPTGLRRRGDRVLLGDEPVDVVYRRVDDERMVRPDGTRTELGELLLPALAAGTLACVNSAGTGVSDDKAVHAYVERMIGFYLDEEPMLRSVPSYDLGEEEQRRQAMPRLEAGELVLKPRFSFGGKGVVVGPLAGSGELREAIDAVRAEPAAWVAQDPVALSVHPTLVDGALAPRHVDLRPFAYSSSNGVAVSPGGLSRFAREEGEMVVNSGRGGGAKDTWVI